MFEAADLQVFNWYIHEFGVDLNLFVDHSQIMQLSCLREGIWGQHPESSGKASLLAGLSGRQRVKITRITFTYDKICLRFPPVVGCVDMEFAPRMRHENLGIEGGDVQGQSTAILRLSWVYVGLDVPTCWVAEGLIGQLLKRCIEMGGELLDGAMHTEEDVQQHQTEGVTE
ncbi:hypothetical protein K438DRAFT_1940023 [Mycena galopus ATCC 62051]|nr:hypothetical protein K438DRAFT_1940023 [Mycena galopus ATCC 62051]